MKSRSWEDSCESVYWDTNQRHICYLKEEHRWETRCQYSFERALIVCPKQP